MAKTWYPVVDYVVCIECGTCDKECSCGGNCANEQEEIIN